ncbi:MAG: T9SS type A sorting domain-containing protein [Bacteroidales bacterium]
MKKLILTFLSIFAIFNITNNSSYAQIKGIYGGGPFYEQSDTIIPFLKNSGFNTMVLWTIHVEINGDFVFNDIKIIEDGAYIGKPEWPEQINAFKEQPSTVTRVEWSLGSASDPVEGPFDFQNIRDLIDKEGIGPNSTLYKNFKLLKEEFPICEGIIYDDENHYDSITAMQLSNLLISLDYQISIAPYNNIEFWSDLYKKIVKENPEDFGIIYLQKYEGGQNVDVKKWNEAFPGKYVTPGLETVYGDFCDRGSSPETINDSINTWKTYIGGSWYWLLDAMIHCRERYSFEEYYKAFDSLRPNEDPTGLDFRITKNTNVNYVYPNPCSEKLVLNPKANIGAFKICNSSGIIVGKFENCKEIDTKHFTPGLYFMIFKNAPPLKFIKH